MARSFRYNYVIPTHFGKVISGASPDDTSPNDYDLYALW